MRLIFSFLLLLSGAVFAPSAMAAAGWCPNYGAVPGSCRYLNWGTTDVCESTSSANLEARIRAEGGYPTVVCTGPLGPTGYCSHYALGTGYYEPCTTAPVVTCTAPQVLDAASNTCVAPPNPCHNGTNVSGGYYDLGTDANANPMVTACTNSCDVNFTSGTGPYGPSATRIVGGVKHYYVAGTYDQTGQQCTGGTPSPASVAVPASPTCTAPAVLNMAGDACVTDPDPFSTCPVGEVKIGFTPSGPVCQPISNPPPPTTQRCPAGQISKNNNDGQGEYCVMASDPCLIGDTCTKDADSTGSTPGAYPISGSSTGGGTGTGESGAASGVPEDVAGMPTDISDSSKTSVEDALKQRDELKDYVANMPKIGPISDWTRIFQPFGTAECVPLTWTFNSVKGGGAHTANFDLCPWVQTIQRVFGWAMYLLTGGLLFQMFTRRPDGGE